MGRLPRLRYLLVVFASLFLATKAASRTRFTFVDPKASFAQFNRWYVSQNGSLSFSFKTHLPDTVLLYQDDGHRDFFSLVLTGGRIVFTLGSAGQTYRTTAGKDVNDMAWHKISISQGIISRQSLFVTLDGKATSPTTTTSPGNGALMKSNSRFLYFGGLPTSLSISTLAVPGVAFEKRFIGCVKDFKVLSGKGSSRALGMVDSTGMKRGCRNACKPQNPCLHEGKCTNEFWKAECDCRGTEFEGNRCEIETPRLSLTASDYITHVMQPVATATDDIILRFKTSNPNGLLLQTSFASDYLIVELYQGTLVLQLDLGSGSLKLEIGEGKVSDGRWHHLEIARKKRNLKMALDGKSTVQGSCPGSLTKFNMQGGDGQVFIAGIDKSRRNPRTLSKTNFEGCIKELQINGNEFVRKVKESDPLFTLVGKVSFSCLVPTTPAPSSAHADPRVTTLRPLTTKKVKTSKLPTTSTSQPSSSVDMTSSTKQPITTAQRSTKISTTGLPVVPTAAKEVEVTVRKCLWPWRRKCRKGKGSRKSSRAPSTTTSRTESSERTTLAPSTKAKLLPTPSCSPNDVRCTSISRDRMTSQPEPTTQPCVGRECSSGGEESKDRVYTSTPFPYSPTGRYNNFTTESDPEVGAVKGKKKTGNLGVVIGLVFASLALVTICALVSWRCKRRTVDYKLNDIYSPDGKISNGKAFDDEFLV